MTTEELEEGKTYTVEWVDGDLITECIYVREHRGFWIFKDKNNMKVFCRPTSIRKITLLKD